jgi:hypothetical protein
VCLCVCVQNPGVLLGTRAWRAAEVPAANGHGNARGLARMYLPLSLGGVDSLGNRLMKEATVRTAMTEAVRGTDQLLGYETAFALGFMRPSPMRPFGPAHVFGHSGAGGSLGFADMQHNISCKFVAAPFSFPFPFADPSLVLCCCAVGYAMNALWVLPTGADPRYTAMIKAVYNAIGVNHGLL